MLGLAVFGEPCFVIEGRERQNGDADFLYIGQLGNGRLDIVALEGAIVLRRFCVTNILESAEPVRHGVRKNLYTELPSMLRGKIRTDLDHLLLATSVKKKWCTLS